MNPDSLELQLREAAWRRPLTAAEQARLDQWLAAHPEARADWAAEAALNAALQRLPETPAPSNLAARVLAEIEREDLATVAARKPKKTNFVGWLVGLGWVPRAAVVVAVLVVGGGALTYRHHRQVVAQAQALQTVATVTATREPALSPEVLQNLDVICDLPPLPGADLELLALDLK
jgi:hypothetical protein